MTNWKKLIYSGSNAELNQLTASTFQVTSFSEFDQIGIGTSTPEFPLQVSGGNAMTSSGLADVSKLAAIFNHNENTTGAGVGIGFSVSTNESNIGAAIVTERVGNNGKAKLHFSTKGTTIEDADISHSMTIDATGNIGIGTPSPDEKLEVAGNIKLSGSTATQKLTAYHTDGEYGLYTGYGIEISRGEAYLRPVTDRGGSLNIGYSGSNEWTNVDVDTPTFKILTSGEEHVIVNSSGQVGIGTTTPGTINGVPFSGVGLHTKFGTLGRTITEGTSFAEFIMNHSNASADQKVKFVLSQAGVLELGSMDDDGSRRTQLSILNNGNVGIGTEPTEKLDVNGNIKLRGTNNLIIGSTGNGGEFDLSSGIRGYRFKNNNGDLVAISESGSVGIGTTTPDARLDVLTTVNNRLVKFRADNGEERFRFYVGASGNDPNLKIYDQDGTTEAIKLAANGDSWFNGGNVGIGIISPTAKLHISGSPGSNLLQLVSKTSDNKTPNYKFLINDNAAGYATTFNMDVTGLDIGHDSDGRDINFITHNQDRLTIKGAGNVGIGTPSPGEKLEVVGNISASGVIKGASLDINGAADISGDLTGIDSLTAVSVNATNNLTTPLIQLKGNITLLNKAQEIYLPLGTRDISGPEAVLNLSNIGNITASSNISASGTILAEDFNVNNDILPISNITSNLGSTTKYFLNTNTYVVRSGGELQFKTNGDNERARITAAGKFGIGTTEPDAKLEVNGNIKATSFTGSLQGTASFAVSASHALVADTALNIEDALWYNGTTYITASTDVQITGSLLVSGTLNTTEDATIGGNLSIEGGSIFGLNGFGITLDQVSVLSGSTNFGSGSNPAQTNHRFTGSVFITGSKLIMDGGKVGIGTDNPQDKLDVQDGYIRVGKPAGAQFKLVPHASNHGYGFYDVNNSNYDMWFYQGKVGIGKGTATPGAKLEISSSENVTAILNSNNTFTFLDIYNDGLNRVQLGNASDGDFIIRTSDTERLRVDSTGKVGIGATSPSNLLHLYEAGNSDAQLYIHATGSAGNENAAGIKLYAHNNYSNEAFVKIDDEHFQIGTTANEHIRMFTNNTERVRILDTGEVGIGEPSPSSKLHISTTGATSAFKAYQDTYQQFELKYDETYHSTMMFGYFGELQYDGNGGYLRLSNKSNQAGSHIAFATSGSRERMRITHDGNVGIGATSPLAKLQVTAGSSGVSSVDTGTSMLVESNTTNYLRFINPDSATGGLVWTSPSDNFGAFIRWGHSAQLLEIGTANSNDSISFSTGNATEKMRLTSTGLGIGTTSPAYKLDVYGDAQITSSQATLYLNSSGNGHTHGRVVIDSTNSTRGGGVYWRDTVNTKQWFSGVGYNNDGKTWHVGYHSGSEGSGDANAAATPSAILTVEADRDKIGVGKVGIGTISPTELLELKPGSGGDSKINILNSSGVQKALIGYDNANGGLINLYNEAGTQNVVVRGYGKSYFNGGNVGIGTTEPDAKLEVNGNVKATSFTGSLQGTASFAVSASHALVADTASYAEFAANADGYIWHDATTYITSSLDTKITGSLDVSGTLSITGYADVSKSIAALESANSTANADNIDITLVPDSVKEFHRIPFVSGSGTAHEKLYVDEQFLFEPSSSTLRIQNGADDQIATVEIRGNANGTGKLYLGESDEVGGGIIFEGDNSPTRIIGSPSVEYTSLYRRNRELVEDETGGFLVVPKDYFVAGYKYNSNDFYFSGSVGIGTISPSYKLDVEISESGTVASFVSTNNKACIQIADNDTIGYVSAENGRISIGPTNGSHVSNMNILTGNSYVGIGNSSPAKKLTVTGEVSASGAIYSEDAIHIRPLSNDSTFAKLASFHGSRLVIGKKANAVFLQVASGGNELEITDAANDNTGKGNVLLRVRGTDQHDGRLMLIPDNSNHRVGIGTESPTETVDIIGNLAFNNRKILDFSNANITRGAFNPIVSSIRNSGKCLRLDTDFTDGTNGVLVYNNAGSDVVTITRFKWNLDLANPTNFDADSVNWANLLHEGNGETNLDSLGVPNSSGYVLRISYDGTGNVGTVTPGLGGFIQRYRNPNSNSTDLFVQSSNQMNHTYVQIFKALVPVGHELVHEENHQGTDKTTYWLTDRIGTGKWEWYARINHVGSSTTDTYDDAGYVYIVPSDGLVYTEPVHWFLASCTVYDVTEADAFTHRRIGVGTINPSASLEVIGDISSSANIYAQNIYVTTDISATNISASSNITASSLTLTGGANVQGDLGIGGSIFGLQGIAVTIDDLAVTSGSTNFGSGSDAAVTQHSFTGSVSITGSTFTYNGENILTEASRSWYDTGTELTSSKSIGISGSVNAYSFTGSLQGTASYAMTASYAENAQDPFPYYGGAVINGILTVDNGSGVLPIRDLTEDDVNIEEGNVVGDIIGAFDVSESIVLSVGMNPDNPHYAFDSIVGISANYLQWTTSQLDESPYLIYNLERKLGYAPILNKYYISFLNPNSSATKIKVYGFNSTGMAGITTLDPGTTEYSLAHDRTVEFDNNMPFKFIMFQFLDGYHGTDGVKIEEIILYSSETNIFGTVENATTAATAVTASHALTALTAVTASHALNAAPVFPYTGRAEFTGSIEFKTTELDLLTSVDSLFVTQSPDPSTTGMDAIYHGLGRVFDGLISTGYGISKSDITDSVTIDYNVESKLGYSPIINKFEVLFPSWTNSWWPSQHQLSGSQDGTNWTGIYRGPVDSSGYNTSPTRTFQFENHQTFNYIRYSVPKSALDTGIIVYDIKYFDAGIVTATQFVGTGSYALYAESANSASYAVSASFVTSASYAATASFVTSASYAATASYVMTASYAENAQDTFPYYGNAVINGTLTVTPDLSSTNGILPLNDLTAADIWKEEESYLGLGNDFNTGFNDDSKVLITTGDADSSEKAFDNAFPVSSATSIGQHLRWNAARMNSNPKIIYKLEKKLGYAPIPISYRIVQFDSGNNATKITVVGFDDYNTETGEYINETVLDAGDVFTTAVANHDRTITFNNAEPFNYIEFRFFDGFHGTSGVAIKEIQIHGAPYNIIGTVTNAVTASYVTNTHWHDSGQELTSSVDVGISGSLKVHTSITASALQIRPYGIDNESNLIDFSYSESFADDVASFFPILMFGGFDAFIGRRDNTAGIGTPANGILMDVSKQLKLGNVSGELKNQILIADASSGASSRIIYESTKHAFQNDSVPVLEISESKSTFYKPIIAQSHITASGNISASGHLIVSGNVGIGTPSPAAKLHVVDNTAFSSGQPSVQVVKLERDVPGGDIKATTEGHISMWASDSNNSNEWARISWVNDNSDDAGSESEGALSFWTKNGGTVTRAMYIDHDQQVGIGTTKPTKALTVTGDISASGKLFAGLSETTTHNDNIMALVYDTSTDELMYTGSYGSGGGGTPTLITAGNDIDYNSATGAVSIESTLNHVSGIYNSSLVLGRDTSDTISFVFDNEIQFVTNNTLRAKITNTAIKTAGNMTIGDNGWEPVNKLDIITSGNDGSQGIQIIRNDSNTGTDELLGGIGFDSADNDTTTIPDNILQSSAYIAAFASEAHGSSAKGGYLSIGTAPNGQDPHTTSNEVIRVNQDQHVHFADDLIAFSTTVSDKRLKTNIQLLTGSLDTICNLEGVRYDWKYRDTGPQLGVIAQQVEPHVPEVVKEMQLPLHAPAGDDSEYKTVQYEQLVPHLIEAIKELKTEVDVLKKRLNDAK